VANKDSVFVSVSHSYPKEKKKEKSGGCTYGLRERETVYVT